MSGYLTVVEAAFLLFPFVALLLTVPYMVVEYRRVGTVPAWRTVVVFSMVLYLLCVVFLVLLPLPPSRTADYGVVPQLHPFDWVAQARMGGVTVDPAHPRTFLRALRNPNVYGAVFNVFMLVPWGFYLRYLFKRRWWQALLLGFGLSLCFELTQLTGVWGLYAHPYRHFDVDDLINNTFGTMIGFWATCLVGPLLPDLDEADERALQRNLRYPPLLRRLIAGAFDAALVIAVVWGWSRMQRRFLGTPFDDASLVLALFCASTLVCVLLPMVDGGRTPGALLCKLRIRDAEGPRAHAGQVFVRQTMTWWVGVTGAVLAVLIVPVGFYEGHAEAIRLMTLTGAALWALSVLVRAVWSAGGHRAYTSLPGLFSHTRMMSQAQALQADKDTEAA